MTVRFIIHNIHEIFSKSNHFGLIYNSPRVCVRACVRACIYICIYLSFNLTAQLKELITVLPLSYFMKTFNM